MLNKYFKKEEDDYLFKEDFINAILYAETFEEELEVSKIIVHKFIEKGIINVNDND